MKKIVLSSLVAALAFVPLAEATYIYKNRKLINKEEMAEFPVEVHFNKGVAAIKEKNWDESLKQFRICTLNFPDAPLTTEAYYFLGVSYYHTGDYDLANQSLSTYLSQAQNPKYFIEALEHKLACANEFDKGACKHLFNQRKLPSLFSCHEEAEKIYDEIITAVPTHEIAIKALLQKANHYAEEKNFTDSIATLQSLIRKFPKTEQACESYVTIASVLLEQAKLEQHNPDLLPLARINLTKFEGDFPQASKEQSAAKKSLITMQEVYAQGLYDLGAFYERKGEPRAACIYYQQTMHDFPETEVAKKCHNRLQALDSYAKSLQ